MIVSLEAIFLSTVVMISQNRADAKRRVVADLAWQTVQDEDRQNQELLRLSSQILELTKAIHSQTNREAAGAWTATRWPGGGAGVVHPYVLRARPAKPRDPADRCRWLPRRDRGPRGQLGCIPAWPRRVAATTLDRRA
jgi:hypothetical protein